MALNARNNPNPKAIHHYHEQHHIYPHQTLLLIHNQLLLLIISHFFFYFAILYFDRLIGSWLWKCLWIFYFLIFSFYFLSIAAHVDRTLFTLCSNCKSCRLPIVIFLSIFFLLSFDLSIDRFCCCYIFYCYLFGTCARANIVNCRWQQE